MLQVVSVAATFCQVWEGVTALIAEVDVLAGFAELATSAPVAYVRPTMLPSDAGEIKLIGCRWVSTTFCKRLPAADQQQLPPSTCHIWSRGKDGHFRHLRLKSLAMGRCSILSSSEDDSAKVCERNHVCAGTPASRRRTVWTSLRMTASWSGVNPGSRSSQGPTWAASPPTSAR